MISKVLVCNRGEIAIRAFRAANQLGIRTVAVHTYEDRNSLHRVKADESYQIGERGHPVRAYLDVDTIVRTALNADADAIYPGYGFLSESPELAAACDAAGLTFVGPPVEALKLAGNKMKARQAAAEAGLPVLVQSPAIDGVASARRYAAEIGYPLFVKAAAGGGGRGLRRVENSTQLEAAIESAMSEAESAFGDATVFLEEAMTNVRHIEVQILAAADATVHLLERDCSVQRRFQKVIEIAPAPNLDESLRRALLDDAVTFARAIGYANAGTVEFLVDDSGRHVFIEMNPRIQVEHTVTEEVTDIDLVESQMLIAGGSTLAELGIDQTTIASRGFALQCRITAEDPTNDFRPDTGRLVGYRQPGGGGIRLDGGTGYVGAEISPYFDSLIVKLTCRGKSLEEAIRRAERALAEFRVRGVSTNIAFLLAVLHDPDFRAGAATTAFIEERPHLTAASVGADRATRLLRYLADVTINGTHGAPPSGVDPQLKLPSIPSERVPAKGSKQLLDEMGASAFAASLREQSTVAVTDTTLRDAHQSILATRLRTIDLVAGAQALSYSQPGLLSLECWGGATYDVALRFLHEDPWERLEQIREAAPNICLQMLLRGRNTVGYAPYPAIVCQRFVEEAHRSGIDIFRIFDALNDIEQMRPAIEATLEAGAVAEGTLCYSGDLSNPNETLYDLDYYLRVAESLVDAEVHILCIKDMAGLLRAPAAKTLVTALRERFDTPVHLHTHDTAGGQLATYLAAIDSGVDAIDGAAPPLSGMTSQPSLAAIITATDHSDRPTGLSLEAVGALEPYWEAVRRVYQPFEAGLRAPTGTVYQHEIPGGQLSNLRQQAIALGLGDRFEEVERLYAASDRLLGRPIKVTPSSKVVGDLALHLVSTGVTPEQLEADPASVDLPESVIGFLRGQLGTPEAGFPEPFRTAALEGRAASPSNGAATEEGASDLRVLAEGAEQPDRAHQRHVDVGGSDPSISVRAVLNRLLFPGPAASQLSMVERYGDLSVLPSRLFFYGLSAEEDEVAVELDRGVRVLIGLEAVGVPDESGVRSVVFTLNGQFRPLDVVDRSVAVDITEAEKADSSNSGHVAAPFRGIVNVTVSVGTEVAAGDSVATIEAMKMEAHVSAPIDGVIDRVALGSSASVEAGDLIVVIRPLGTANTLTAHPPT